VRTWCSSGHYKEGVIYHGKGSKKVTRRRGGQRLMQPKPPQSDQKVNPSTLGSVDLVPQGQSGRCIWQQLHGRPRCARPVWKRMHRKPSPTHRRAQGFSLIADDQAIFTLAHKVQGLEEEIDVFGIFGDVRMWRLNKRILIEWA